MKNQNAFKLSITLINRTYTLSPRYDSSEECRVSYSLISGGPYG